MIEWGALTPDPDYRRRQQDLGLRRAVVEFNERAVPALGNLWFSMPVAWGLIGLKVAQNRDLNPVTVANAIEALAMKAAHAAGGTTDPDLGSRLRGHRKLALLDDRSYAALSRRGAYVSQPLRQMLQQSLDGLGLARGGRFGALQLLTEAEGALETEPFAGWLRSVDAWVGGGSAAIGTALSPLGSVPRPLAILLRSRLFEDGPQEHLVRRRAVRDATWLDDRAADVAQFRDPAPRSPFDADHWRDLRAGAALLALRHQSLMLLRRIEDALLTERREGRPVRLPVEDATTRFADDLGSLAREADALSPMIEPAAEPDSLAFLRELRHPDPAAAVRSLVRRDGTVLRLADDTILPGPVGVDLRAFDDAPDEDEETDGPGPDRPGLGRLHALRALAAELDSVIDEGATA